MAPALDLNNTGEECPDQGKDEHETRHDDSDCVVVTTSASGTDPHDTNQSKGVENELEVYVITDTCDDGVGATDKGCETSNESLVPKTSSGQSVSSEAMDYLVNIGVSEDLAFHALQLADNDLSFALTICYADRRGMTLELPAAEDGCSQTTGKCAIVIDSPVCDPNQTDGQHDELEVLDCSEGEHKSKTIHDAHTIEVQSLVSLPRPLLRRLKPINFETFEVQDDETKETAVDSLEEPTLSLGFWDNEQESDVTRLKQS